MSNVVAEKPKSGGWLGTIERIGNKVPHPVLMFLYLIIGVIVLSAILDWTTVLLKSRGSCTSAPLMLSWVFPSRKSASPGS